MPERAWTETADDRSEQPTPLRLDEARKRGKVARSRELVSAAMLLCSVGLFALFARRIVSELSRMTASLLDFPGAGMKPETLGADIAAATAPVLWLLAPLGLALMVAAILANLIQGGPVASADLVRPDFARLSPGRGLRSMFSLRSLVRTLLCLGRMVAVAVVCWVTVFPAGGSVAGAAGAGVWTLVGEGCDLLVRLGLRLGACLLALGVLDWLFERLQHRRELKMTRREVVEDLRRMGIDPELRKRRRKEARSRLLAMRGALHTAGAAESDIQ